jgi:hypothetical protein
MVTTVGRVFCAWEISIPSNARPLIRIHRMRAKTGTACLWLILNKGFRDVASASLNERLHRLYWDAGVLVQL